MNRIVQDPGLRAAPLTLPRRQCLARLATTPLWALGLGAPLAATASAGRGGLTVYHVQNSNEQAVRCLLYVNNHIVTDRQAEVQIVGHAGGVDFMLIGAATADGVDYETAIRDLQKSGRVEFVVCALTLVSRSLRADALVPGVRQVPSGVAHIATLQQQRQAAYIRP